MTIQEHIKNDLVVAMREKNENVKSILRVVIGEFNRVGKEVSDENAISILKKMNQNAIDQGNSIESTILELYLPKQLTEAELTDVIKHIILRDGYSTMKYMGNIMGSLKEDYVGTYDGKLASTIVRKLLS